MPDRQQLFWLFFRLRGRLGRQPYLLAGLLLLVIQLFLFYRVALSAERSTESQAWAFAFLAVAAISQWSNFALTAKRLHDFGKPAAIALLTLVFGFIVFIVLAFFESDPGPNRYGSRTNAAG